LNVQRIEQMNVYPDLVPKFTPEVDCIVRTTEDRWRFKGLKWKGRVRKGELRRVICGGYLDASHTLRAPPTLNVQVWHPSVRFYTLILVDPDVPSPSISSFTTYIHAAYMNIPLSLTYNYVPLPPTESSLPLDDKEEKDPFKDHHKSIIQLRGYVPPHPQKGTPPHRYVWLVLEQNRKIGREENLVEELKSHLPRDGASIRELLNRFPVVKEIKPIDYTEAEAGTKVHEPSEPLSLQVKGSTFWRASYSARGGTSQVYRHILKREEPEFGLEPKIDRYTREKGRRWSRFYEA